MLVIFGNQKFWKNITGDGRHRTEPNVLDRQTDRKIDKEREREREIEREKERLRKDEQTIQLSWNHWRSTENFDS